MFLWHKYIHTHTHMNSFTVNAAKSWWYGKMMKPSVRNMISENLPFQSWLSPPKSKQSLKTIQKKLERKSMKIRSFSIFVRQKFLFSDTINSISFTFQITSTESTFNVWITWNQFSIQYHKSQSRYSLKYRNYPNQKSECFHQSAKSIQSWRIGRDCLFETHQKVQQIVGYHKNELWNWNLFKC